MDVVDVVDVVDDVENVVDAAYVVDDVENVDVDDVENVDVDAAYVVNDLDIVYSKNNFDTYKLNELKDFMYKKKIPIIKGSKKKLIDHIVLYEKNNI